MNTKDLYTYKQGQTVKITRNVKPEIKDIFEEEKKTWWTAGNSQEIVWGAEDEFSLYSVNFQSFTTMVSLIIVTAWLF